MLKRVRLELARGRDFPDGSTRHGYELVLPLGAQGRLDRAAWEDAPEVCTAHRFWEGEADAVGELVHPDARDWAFSYEPGDGDDELVPRLDEHVLRLNEYLSIRTHDGEIRTFRVVLVEPAPGLAMRPGQ
jgi:hypothetical protein